MKIVKFKGFVMKFILLLLFKASSSVPSGNKNLNHASI